jgi:hypothetical protein
MSRPKHINENASTTCPKDFQRAINQVSLALDYLRTARRLSRTARLIHSSHDDLPGKVANTVYNTLQMAGSHRDTALYHAEEATKILARLAALRD